LEGKQGKIKKKKTHPKALNQGVGPKVNKLAWWSGGNHAKKKGIGKTAIRIHFKALKNEKKKTSPIPDDTKKGGIIVKQGGPNFKK